MTFIIEYQVLPLKEVSRCGYVARNRKEAETMFKKRHTKGQIIKIIEQS